MMMDKSNKRYWIPWMRRVFSLASLAEGQTSPNPLVGALVLDSSEKLVGEGFHACTGQPHAEVGALAQAGEASREGTLVVNLEPCCHQGKTPPCTEAILRSGISRVVIAIKDPDPRVSGKGIALLRDAGVEVIFGVLEKEATYLNRGFVFRNRTGRPWGILKWAMSVDGRTALPNGSSKWISGKSSRARVHALRSKCDAVIVGGSTVRIDDPLLTSRGLAEIEPLRVVLSSSLDLPFKAKLWDTNSAKTLICFGPGSDSKKLDQLPKDIEQIELQESSPTELLKTLAKKGCNQVLWECGPSLATAAIEEGCVQEIVVFIAPKLLGGLSAKTALSDFGFTSMDQVLKAEKVFSSLLGEDFVLKMVFEDQL